MSFPNIPDVHPCIDIEPEDAASLLLTSIAQEEISISKLLDAETCKLLRVLDGPHGKGADAHNAVKINESVNATIKNLIKFQMLLQFKLEEVVKLVPKPCPPSPCPPCPPPPPCPPVKNKCCCVLKGKGCGCVTNSCDSFFRRPAELYAFIFSDDDTGRTLRYSVEGEEESLRLDAAPRETCVRCCPADCGDRMVIAGKGRAVLRPRCGPEISGSADFTLTAAEVLPGTLEFRMEIRSECGPLNHDSGFIRVKAGSDLRMMIRCRPV